MPSKESGPELNNTRSIEVIDMNSEQFNPVVRRPHEELYKQDVENLRKAADRGALVIKAAGFERMRAEALAENAARSLQG